MIPSGQMTRHFRCFWDPSKLLFHALLWPKCNAVGLDICVQYVTYVYRLLSWYGIVLSELCPVPRGRDCQVWHVSELHCWCLGWWQYNIDDDHDDGYDDDRANHDKNDDENDDENDDDDEENDNDDGEHDEGATKTMTAKRRRVLCKPNPS